MVVLVTSIITIKIITDLIKLIAYIAITVIRTVIVITDAFIIITGFIR